MDPDSYDEMHPFRPTDDTYDRLLAGRLSPLDAPESLRGVAALFEAASGPATAHELVHKSAVVAAATELVQSTNPYLSTAPSRRRSMISKVLTAKFAAAATVAVFGLGTAAAAATGTLPGQTQHANTHASFGLATAAASVASRGQSNSTTQSGTHTGAATSSPSGSIPSTGPANSHAQFGLCTAFLAAGKSDTSTPAGSTTSPSTPPQYDSTAFKALIAQNGGIAGTTSYCNGVVASHPSGTGTTQPGQPAGSGKPTHPGKSGDAGKPSTAGSSSSHAPVTTPNGGGTGTADTASGGASSTGTSTADAASGGASSAGSANAGTHH